MNKANLDLFPERKSLLINAGFHTQLVPLQEELVRDVKATLYLMWGGAIFVLLIGWRCATNIDPIAALTQ